MTRRTVLKSGLAAGVALAADPAMPFTSRLSRFANRPNQEIPVQPPPFKLKYAPHFGMFRNHAGDDPVDQLKFAADQGFRAWDGKMGKRARFLAKLLMRVRNGIPEREAIEAAVDALRALWDAVRNGDEDAPSSNDRLLLSVDDAERLNPD